MPPDKDRHNNSFQSVGDWIAESQNEDELMDRLCQIGDYIHQQKLIRLLKSMVEE